MHDLKFSVIIPTYNRAHLIKKTLESLLNQTYDNFEILVIDDGSTDDTGDIVKAIRDPRIFYYKKINAERGAARNFGAQKATGEYVNFFDSDDIAYSDHLQSAFDTVIKFNMPDVFVLNYNYGTPENNISKTGPSFYDINLQIKKGNILSCDGVFIQKEVISSYPFSELRELSATEDFLLWLQLASRYRIYHNNKRTSSIINHEQRSVIAIKKESLIKRIELFLKLATEDQNIKRFYHGRINVLKSNSHSYISLHLSILNDKKGGLKFLWKSLGENPLLLFKKRFFVILKIMGMNFFNGQVQEKNKGAFLS